MGRQARPRRPTKQDRGRDTWGKEPGSDPLLCGQVTGGDSPSVHSGNSPKETALSEARLCYLFFLGGNMDRGSLWAREVGWGR